jgi:hypothetical protein
MARQRAVILRMFDGHSLVAVPNRQRGFHMHGTDGPLSAMDGAMFEATLRANKGVWQASYLVNRDLNDLDSAEGETQLFDSKEEAKKWLASAASDRGFEKYDLKEGSWI